MLDAQEVRKRQLEAVRQPKLEEAKSVFQWILEMIDKATTDGYFSSITVWQYDDNNCINAGGNNYTCNFSRDEIFPVICEVINSEEGYHAEYRKDVVYYDEYAWVITVTVD